VASAVRSRLGPNHDVQNTIVARRRAERVDNTTTTIGAVTTTVDAGGATTATTTGTPAGRRTKGVRVLLVRESATQSPLRASALRPSCQGTTGVPTPVCGSRTTGLLATLGERPTTSLSSRISRRHGSSTCAGQDQRLDRPTSGLRQKYPRHLHAPRQAVGAAQLQAAAGGRVSASTYDASPSVAPSSSV
jgi:hypothetical protein